MNKRIKELWLKALRSGKYRQVKAELKANLPGKHVGYCCLGVLCDIHSKETGKKWENRNMYFNADTVLPQEVMDWAGLDDDNPKVYYDIGLEHLSELNDERNCSFKEIADLIEKEL